MPAKSHQRPRVKSKAPAVATAEPSQNLLIYSLACLGALVVAFQLYWPALHGQFVFDDLFLTYTNPHAASLPLSTWIGLRPVLGLSFWATFQEAGLDTFPYHVVNVFLHSLSTILVFLIARKLLRLSGTDGPLVPVLAGFAAALFLVHPVQSEAVAYIASRSETLSVFFVFCALCLFLYRRSAEIDWLSAMAVLAMFGLAIGTKEHAIALPAVLLLTDYFWNPGFSFSGIRRNWRLYLPIAVAAFVAALLVWSYVSRDAMIGFNLKGLAWYQYFFTECRAFFGYLGLFVLPVGLNVDHEFAESHTILEHGAILAMVCLLALLGAAHYYRRRFPLASYGFLLFVILLAPTSSFIPIRDVFVERRLYLPFLGLLLILLEPLRRLRMPPRTLALILACFCLIPAYMTWRRAAVWTSVTRLWEDSVATAPGKLRPHVGLGNAYMHDNRCSEAAREYEAASRLPGSDFTLKYNLAAAYECLHRPAEAEGLLNEAIAESPKSAPDYALLGMVQAEMGKVQSGMEYLDRAERLDPRYALTHAYRGLILATMGQAELAGREFEACLQLDPANSIARKGLERLNGSR